MSGRDSPAQPLPRGRHKLGKEAVLASQRERLLIAMEELVNENGYGGASVPKVVRRARVTDRTFYALFEDKADCFIATCERHGDQLRDLLDAYVDQIENAQDAMAVFDAGLHQYLQWWMARPGGARAYFVDILTVGDRAFASRDRRAAIFAEALRRIARELRRRAGVAGEPADVDVTAAAMVATELVARHVRAGRIAELSDLHADLRRVLLLLLLAEPSR
ncbi:TetR/AcrR family transcriptional regulator [Mycobacterium sp. CVI_P3]|uniref:TetR/AcrR family transcriptional regulator n=1 Tax=Mycobacterium pinniadriaticum TaxID=2994102 RepID=A0ABT3S9B3_9MYCO|nr:TetR/AcrR family transcriptional regulator [Mycobacterium pinniadriaticum]MCX2929685.1 TetR/AcrR family transcriptional regulator [Mycobacterium pinniadriaticum]MCX2936109.1 TetR/AcrR family transcriptional regulator [Mycobacterium pinniadriaticum]